MAGKTSVPALKAAVLRLKPNCLGGDRFRIDLAHEYRDLLTAGKRHNNGGGKGTLGIED
jgi:hypothetical protein